MSPIKISTILGITVALAGAAQAQRMPPRSFLNKPVKTIPDLIKQINEDPVVAKRFMLHYGLNKDELIGYIKTFKLDTLKEAGTYKVYHVDSKYTIGSREMKFPKGTPVFVDAMGRPIMFRVCGNPTKYPIITPRLLIENPIPAETTPSEEQAPVESTPVEMMTPNKEWEAGWIPPAPPPEEIIKTKKSFVPFPIPIPFTTTRTKFKECVPCKPIPGPAAAISFLGMAGASALRRRRKR
jgi:hypothetical protein